MLKTKSPADAAVNGQTSPADDTYNPENASQIIPAVFPTGPANPATCAMRTLRPQADEAQPALPQREKTHIESIT